MPEVKSGVVTDSESVSHHAVTARQHFVDRREPPYIRACVFLSYSFLIPLFKKRTNNAHTCIGMSHRLHATTEVRINTEATSTSAKPKEKNGR